MERLIRIEGLEKQWNAFGWMVKRYLGVEMVCVGGKENRRDSEGIWELCSKAVTEYTSGGRVAGETKIGWLMRTYRGYFTAWKLFPGDCLRYWWRLVWNNVKGVGAKVFFLIIFVVVVTY